MHMHMHIIIVNAALAMRKIYYLFDVIEDGG